MPRPTRIEYQCRIRPVAAFSAGLVSGIGALVAYYLTLALLPTAFAYPLTRYPVAAWAERFDLAQFAGTFVRPPYPTPFTWRLGIVLLIGAFITFGIVYAVLLSWSLQKSDLKKGLGFGGMLGLGLLGLMTIANGLQPAIMRNALPDTGLLLLGWSGWATLQLLFVHLLYGALLGTLYGRWTRR